ncbi:MAG: twin-arginine translocase subunit TatC [Actinobacteria bacterium]|nr:twin-arginine translocase subunit TatC [Actinomycetota bacterium]
MSKDPTRTMSLMGHLGELRKRFTYIAIVVVVCVIAAFVLKDYVLAILLHPLRLAGFKGNLAVMGVTEGFMQILKVSIYSGLLIALPFILYQFWAFVIPALYENEKRSTIPYVAFTTILFLAGVTFGYFVVLPVGLKFMVGYGGQYFNQLFQADKYFNFISMFLLAFGCVFELPLVMMLLAWAGLVNHKQMRKVRKYAILVEAVIAMVFTPSQDPLSMTLMLVPLIILYEFGIWLAKIAVRRRERRRELAVLSEG